MKKILLCASIAASSSLVAQTVDTLGSGFEFLDYARISTNEKYVAGRIAQAAPIFIDLENGTDTIFDYAGIFLDVANSGVAVGRFIDEDDTNTDGNPYDKGVSCNMATDHLQLYRIPNSVTAGNDQFMSAFQVIVDETNMMYGQASGLASNGHYAYGAMSMPLEGDDADMQFEVSSYDEYYSNIYDAKYDYTTGDVYTIGWEQEDAVSRAPRLWKNGVNQLNVAAMYGGEIYGINDITTIAAGTIDDYPVSIDIATGDTTNLKMYSTAMMNFSDPSIVDNNGLIYGHNSSFGWGSSNEAIVWITADSVISLQQYLLTKGIIFEDYVIDRVMDVTPNGNTLLINAFHTINMDITTLLVHIDDNVTSIQEEINVFNSVKAFPNPVTDILNIEVNTKEQTTVQLNVYGISGALIDQVNVGQISGHQVIEYSTSSLPQGSYVIQIKTDLGSEVIKVTK